VSAVAGAAAAARDVLTRADALGRAFEALAAATDDEARRASLARAAGRLASSVVRPLGAALVASADGTPAPGTEGELAVALHALAVDATRLRVGVGGPPALLEAAAALQDLTCQLVADDEERLSARRGEFATLQEALAPSIQSAPDGPYLVTNVATLTDWLGVSLAPLPQAALCRCGASQLKPWCDGSHGVIGFQAAKAPDRVPDRLDTYQGQHVTITDNRGICAHSGFCTDRAPTAFRTSTEPFIAPSGARADEIVRAARDCRRSRLRARRPRSRRRGRSGPRGRDRGLQGRPVSGHRRNRALRRRRQARAAQQRLLARALQPLPLRQVAEQAVLQRHALVRGLPRPAAARAADPV
jgi:CDGSH-type Zn-finger protein